MEDEAADFLYSILGAIPDPDFGVINLLPWSVDSDETNALKKKISIDIARELKARGLLVTEVAPSVPASHVTIDCRTCSTTLTTVMAIDGVANVPAGSFITDLGRRTADCPHQPVTADDQRRAIEHAVLGL